MPQTGYTRSPKIQKGALVQLVEEIVGILPRIIPFQYNPDTLRRSMSPFNPAEISEANRGQLAPTAQPFDPKEQINVEIELDASDALEDGDGIAEQFGVADRIAAIEKLLLPTAGLIGDLLNAAASLVGASKPAARPSVAIVLFVWGVGRILPVRITSYSIDEQLFLPSLHPIQARVSLGMEVLTPDVFKCQSGLAVDIAITAYRFFRLQQEALALAHAARNVEAARGLLPF
jgi:hypothetical protein